MMADNIFPLTGKPVDQLDMQVHLAVQKIRRECWMMGVKLGLNENTTADCQAYMARCEAIDASKKRHPSNRER